MSEGIKALDGKINFKMFVKTIFTRGQKILAENMTAEEKLDMIMKDMAKDVQKKRVDAREAGAEKQISTKELETLEAQRKGLVTLGASICHDPEKSAQVGQVSQKLAVIDSRISARKSLLTTQTETYDLAAKNYQDALNAYETAKSNGPAMIKAIKAQKTALERRDNASEQKTMSIDFLNDLASELENAKAELRSDIEITEDLDPSKSFNVNAELAKMDAQNVNAGYLAEFQTAAAAK